MSGFEERSVEQARELVRSSIDRPSAARVYDYILGGGHNYSVDREFARKQLDVFPDIRLAMTTNRQFLGRAVRFAVAAGIRQFIDIGSGLPSAGNVHEIADQADPDRSCRVVYIDNEPIAHAHARILLADNADAQRHLALDADFFDREGLWSRIVDSGYIDPAEPVCLLAVALLHFMSPEAEPRQTLAYYADQLAPGSMLALSHVTNDELPDDAAAEAVRNYASTANPVYFRTRDEITGLFGDWPLVDPGVVWAPLWHADPDFEAASSQQSDPARSKMLAGLARKPERG